MTSKMRQLQSLHRHLLRHCDVLTSSRWSAWRNVFALVSQSTAHLLQCCCDRSNSKTGSDVTDLQNIIAHVLSLEERATSAFDSLVDDFLTMVTQLRNAHASATELLRDESAGSDVSAQLRLQNSCVLLV